jgi:hypothetical protein
MTVRMGHAEAVWLLRVLHVDGPFILPRLDAAPNVVHRRRLSRRQDDPLIRRLHRLLTQRSQRVRG